MGMTVNAMAGMQAASENVSDYSVTAKAAETSEKKASAETEKDAVYERAGKCQGTIFHQQDEQGRPCSFGKAAQSGSGKQTEQSYKSCIPDAW